MQARLEAEPHSHLLPMELSYIKFYIIVFQIIVQGGEKAHIQFQEATLCFLQLASQPKTYNILSSVKKMRSYVFHLQAHLWHFKLHGFQLALTSHWFFKHIFPIVSSTQSSDYFAKENNA